MGWVFIFNSLFVRDFRGNRTTINQSEWQWRKFGHFVPKTIAITVFRSENKRSGLEMTTVFDGASGWRFWKSVLLDRGDGASFACSTGSSSCAEPDRSECLSPSALCVGTVAGAAKLGRLEDAAHVPGLYRVSAAVGHLHAAAVAQLQQGAHHQVHVVPDVARVPDAVAANGGHHAVLQGGPAKSVPVLVRVAAFGEYGRRARVQGRFRWLSLKTAFTICALNCVQCIAPVLIIYSIETFCYFSIVKLFPCFLFITYFRYILLNHEVMSKKKILRPTYTLSRARTFVFIVKQNSFISISQFERCSFLYLRSFKHLFIFNSQNLPTIFKFSRNSDVSNIAPLVTIFLSWSWSQRLQRRGGCGLCIKFTLRFFT